MADGWPDIVHARVHQDSFARSPHAQREAAAEQISVDDSTHARRTGQELEPYPDDPRGPSCFMVGQDTRGRWRHVLCGNFDRANVLIITVLSICNNRRSGTMPGRGG